MHRRGPNNIRTENTASFLPSNDRMSLVMASLYNSCILVKPFPRTYCNDTSRKSGREAVDVAVDIGTEQISQEVRACARVVRPAIAFLNAHVSYEGPNHRCASLTCRSQCR